MIIGAAIFKAFLIFVPSYLINTDGRVLLELEEARIEQFDVDVMKLGCELEVKDLTKRLTHILQSA